MKIKAPDALLAAEVSRRGLMKTTAIGGLALASNALTLPFTRLSHAADTPAPASEKVVWSACTVNCGSRCPLRMHVVDGAIKYVEMCIRDRLSRARVYLLKSLTTDDIDVYKRQPRTPAGRKRHGMSLFII